MSHFTDSSSASNDYNADVFLIRQMINAVHTAAPVRVEAVDTGRKTVTVTPMVSLVDARGRQVAQSPIYNVPYIRMQGGENALITDPAGGDIGLAVFCMRDISAVKSSGTPNVPGSYRTYNPADAIYIGGFINKAPKRYIKISEAGVEIEGVQQVTVSGASVSVSAESVTVEAADTDITSASVNVTGAAVINGSLLVNGGIAWTGIASPPAGAAGLKFQGNVEVTGRVTGTTVTAGSVSLAAHVHSISGGGNTGGPT